MYNRTTKKERINRLNIVQFVAGQESSLEKICDDRAKKL